jgi:hypothetical protein
MLKLLKSRLMSYSSQTPQPGIALDYRNVMILSNYSRFDSMHGLSPGCGGFISIFDIFSNLLGRNVSEYFATRSKV